MDCNCCVVKPGNTAALFPSTNSGAMKKTRAKVLMIPPLRSRNAADKAMLWFTGRSRTYQSAVVAILLAISMIKTVKPNSYRPLCVRKLVAVAAASLATYSLPIDLPEGTEVIVHVEPVVH